MLTAKAVTDGDKKVKSYYVVTQFSDETLSQAKNIFGEYTNVFLNENFDDDTWILTNQITRMKLHFSVDGFSFNRYAEKWLGCSYRCFVNGVKAYIVFNMGSFGFQGLRKIFNKLLCICKIPYEKLPDDVHILEFLKLLPDSEIKDQVIESMEERVLFSTKRRKNNGQRILASFETYFRFNDNLDDYWENASEKDKLFYFPLYFWWNLTAILPLRPTEFLLTPRNCVERKDDENILTIRRTTLKGGKNITRYRINSDYKLMKYSVTAKLAAEVEWYVRATENMPKSTLDTLFVQQPHYSYCNRSAPSCSVYYSYYNLSYCLEKFQREIMEMDFESNRINLGDTRHLAMISLIVSGGSPVICKELAGHEDINISSHYYSNISRFVECATYEMYKKQKSNAVDMLTHRRHHMEKTVDVFGGKCDSDIYISGKIDECIKSIGPNGEIGECIFCPHFIDGKTGKYILFSDTTARKKQVDDDSKYLMSVLELVRKGNGCNEDIQSALLRLQNSSVKYSQSLYLNMEGRL